MSHTTGQNEYSVKLVQKILSQIQIILCQLGLDLPKYSFYSQLLKTLEHRTTYDLKIDRLVRLQFLKVS